MTRRLPATLALALLAALPLRAEEVLTLAPVTLTDWRAVQARVEPRDRLPARARLGGTLVELAVAEGQRVAKGEVLARVVDDKLAFQLRALEARRTAAEAQRSNAEAELARGEELLKQGVTTAQRLDALRTAVDVARGQIAALEAEAEVIGQAQAEGAVLAPADGLVLDVPVAAGAVVMPGEAVATLAVGGTFLRLAVPERHMALLAEGAAIGIAGLPGITEGRLARLYPLVENGRVLADVEVAGLPDRFIDARVQVRLPVGARQALVVPQAALVTRGGLDLVGVAGEGGEVRMRAVVPGDAGPEGVEILSGLLPGDRILTVAPAAAPAGGAAHD
jgi:RND family efflux transporter MFP subunit